MYKHTHTHTAKYVQLVLLPVTVFRSRICRNSNEPPAADEPCGNKKSPIVFSESARNQFSAFLLA